MLRIVFAAVTALTLCAPAALACEGQTGKVILEDKFTDDSAGWAFSEAYGLVLKAPGATITLVGTNNSGGSFKPLNLTFNATQGDFCAEMSFPADAAQLGAGIGVVFLATDDANLWSAVAFTDGEVTLNKLANNQWTVVWQTPANNTLVKTGPTDVNSVRAVVKNGTITIIVNGQTIKSVRAQIPGGDLKFGFYGGYSKPSATPPISYTIHSYKVTAVE